MAEINNQSMKRVHRCSLPLEGRAGEGGVKLGKQVPESETRHQADLPPPCPSPRGGGNGNGISGVEIPADAVTKEDIEEFTNLCVWARSSYLHQRGLYEDRSDDELNLLSKIAPLFFGDLSAIFKEYIILQVCKITDPWKQGKDKNLSISFFIQHICFPAHSGESLRLKDLCEKIEPFLVKIRPVRNKIISHADHATIRNRLNLGAASNNEWDDFWIDLQEIVCILNQHVSGEKILINTFSSDAAHVVYALKHK